MLLTKVRVFVSFDFRADNDLRGSFMEQAGRQDSPFSISDVSLHEGYRSSEWVSKAQRAIEECDVFVVLLGNNTHQAPGVLTEVKIARGLKKRRFQLRPKDRNPKPVNGGGPTVKWDWPNLQRALNG